MKPTLWGREPALILAAIQAVIALAVGFGLPVTTEQAALVLAASAAVLGVITRQQVTPNAAVAAKVDTPPPGIVAGPAASAPEGTPVAIIDATPDPLDGPNEDYAHRGDGE